ncbi:ParB/RepB/Spo0J family partition protein [Frankia sp. AgB32]|uniref:ParB/RepB/Spo0J family partition protein n=1 Tax=Frankia sp. AgB32 TaxID=631119 RepID=UPI00200EE56B|nr:ParB/RepB/Spo0J family partition protein [Frankia sp. AgB32]
MRRLAALDSEPPPILVHRQTMRVVDGMHRLRAAALRGRRTVRIVYFDGTADEAFLHAVEINTVHGLPLSLPDRKAAVTRIIESHPELSDRRIAKCVGLSAKTVAAVRRSRTELPQPPIRKGLDGRIRPVDPSRGRRIAGEVIASRPGASLREIAREAGVSVATAKDVKDRVRRGENPAKHARTAVNDGPVPLDWLRRDPSIKLSESGRRLLGLLSVHSAALDRWSDIIAAVPPHWNEILARLAAHYSAAWKSIELDLRSRSLAEDEIS